MQRRIQPTPSSEPHNHISLGPGTAKNDGPEVAQNWIKDKGHTWAITGPNLRQLITLNWPWTRPKQVLLLVPILSQDSQISNSLIIKIKTKQLLKCFTLHVMNLKYMKVSLFEISYKKKINFFTIFSFSEMHLYKCLSVICQMSRPLIREKSHSKRRCVMLQVM